MPDRGRLPVGLGAEPGSDADRPGAAAGTATGPQQAKDQGRVIRPAGLFGAGSGARSARAGSGDESPAAKPAAPAPAKPAAPPKPPAEPADSCPDGERPPAAATGEASAPRATAAGEPKSSQCQRYPKNKKVLINLKPDTELMELVGWIKAISCRPFILPSNVRQEGDDHRA